MGNEQKLYQMGQLDFLMNWIDFNIKNGANNYFICSHLNISIKEADSLLQYYKQWIHDEIIIEAGRANVVKTFVERHEFLSLEQQANLLNLSPEKLTYYLANDL